MSPDPAEERLRRLLAEARHDEPVPPEVAARLDDTLAQLESERAHASAMAEVGELAARRRRNAARLLLVAAAVVVAGAGVGRLVSTQGGAESVMDAGGSAAEAPAADGQGLREAGPGEGEAEWVTAPPVDPAHVVRADRFSDDVARLAAPGTTTSAAPEAAGSADSNLLVAPCDPGPYGPGRLLGVLYDGVPAVLAIRPVAGESRVVELLECGSGAVLRTTTLPAR